MCSKASPAAVTGGLLIEDLGRQSMRDLRRLLELLGKIPWQQLLDAIDRMIRDSFQHVMQIPLRIDVVELARLDQAVNDCRPITARIGSKEQIIFATNASSADRAFGDVVIDLEAAILRIAL